ncbi:hypothetical protein CLAFUW4_07025 [Fulvia fulva]|nr:hypothetical protein CLAFUR4_07034 [Fulvia fulva]KAK4622402.1 hypothetical protein CLAFUR0_07032 [Fulvia fulva]WPV16726.1 hypothetical protein CLAFUW4_07025 [Fulvia fulva]WPV30784.1 hypothetical protein CLAFUW7_07025 [Fulvia fulva]
MVQVSTLATLAVAVVGVHSFGAKCPDNKCAQKATPYCSSYLGVPAGKTVTSTTTSTTTAIVTKYTNTKNVRGKPTTITTTITVPKTEKTTVTSTSATETQSTVTVAPTCKAPTVIPDVPSELDPEGILLKRQNHSYGQPYGQPAKPTKPACMNSYKERADVTKACKCLSIKPSVTTVKKTATITQTSTVKKCKEITTAPTVTSTTTIEKGKTTKTETTTTILIKTLDPTTVTEGPIAIPTSFNIVSSNAQFAFGNAPGPVIPNGLYATIDPVTEGGPVGQQQPIDFAQAIAQLATVFSLGEDGALTIGDDQGTFEQTAFFTTGEVLDVTGGDNDPLLITYGADADQTKPVSCVIAANEDGTCGLTCTGSGFAPEVQYICGLDKSFYIGSGQDAESGDATCFAFSPLVVDAASVTIELPETGDLPDLGDIPDLTSGGGAVLKKIAQQTVDKSVHSYGRRI